MSIRGITVVVFAVAVLGCGGTDGDEETSDHKFSQERLVEACRDAYCDQRVAHSESYEKCMESLRDVTTVEQMHQRCEQDETVRSCDRARRAEACRRLRERNG